MSRLAPDVCVIGAGAAGTALAVQLASAGRRVVVVEPGTGDGGVAVAIGMNAFLSAARDARRRNAGQSEPVPEADFRAAMRHLRDVQARTAPNRATERLTALGITVVRERARFRDQRTVIAGEHEVQAGQFVVATGSVAIAPAIPGLDAVDYLTEESVLSLSRRPARLVIAGSGSYALAYAQAMRALGCEVTLVADGELLDGFEPDQAAMLLACLRGQGVEIAEQSSIASVEPRGKTGAFVHVQPADGEARVIEASRLLVIRERAPAIDGLDLAKGRVWVGPKGILVDAWLRTRNRRVHAIGDVTGAGCSVHQAEHHAAIVAGTVLRGRREGKGAGPTPAICMTDPAIASIGLTEEQARGHRGMRTVRLPLAENPHSLAERAGPGFIKIVTDHREAILGVSILAPDAAEMIGVWSLAIQHDLTVGDMAETVPAFPTAGEIGKRAAIFYRAHAARKAGILGRMRLPRLFG